MEKFLMIKLKTLAAASVVSLMLAATGASAAITTFAQFAPRTSARNLRWVNNGTCTPAATCNATNGTGGRLYTTATGTATAPGNAPVNFQFLQPGLVGLGAISANFFMNVTVPSGNPATLSGTTLGQALPTGGFSFTSTAPITIGSVTFAAGTNLLSATFTNGRIGGSATSGSFIGNSSIGTLLYTSDFLDFTSVLATDFSMSLTSISPSLFRSTTGGAKALRTFRAFSNGSFSSDPAPIVVGIPEPEMWGLLVVGFGLVGLQVRRRNRTASVAA
jgi:hypothetical protein